MVKIVRLTGTSVDRFFQPGDLGTNKSASLPGQVYMRCQAQPAIRAQDSCDPGFNAMITAVVRSHDDALSLAVTREEIVKFRVYERLRLAKIELNGDTRNCHTPRSPTTALIPQEQKNLCPLNVCG